MGALAAPEAPVPEAAAVVASLARAQAPSAMAPGTARSEVCSNRRLVKADLELSLGLEPGWEPGLAPDSEPGVLGIDTPCRIAA
ncbi:unannotated protein [freshwater metagenome]|uniref:Unannotated protein n=1 Tax=freshwater metagenome TaxID=449393 RepID=A0A6J7REI6_9ZZZZ